MVTLRNGNVNDHLAELAIARGGHVRVGLEDYTGPEVRPIMNWSPRHAVLPAPTGGAPPAPTKFAIS